MKKRIRPEIIKNNNKLTSKINNNSIINNINQSSNQNLSNKTNTINKTNTGSNKGIYQMINKSTNQKFESKNGSKISLEQGLNKSFNKGLNQGLNQKITTVLNQGLNQKITTGLNQGLNQKIITGLNQESTQSTIKTTSTNQIINPFNMKPPEYKDNYRESINEIITLNSRLTKLFKSLNVSSNFTITFNNLPKTYIDTLKNPVYLATEDYVLNQLSTAELGDLTNTVNFKNKEISFITQGPIQLQDNIINTIDNEGTKYLNINYLNDLTMDDIIYNNEPDKYYLYYNSNENDLGYTLYNRISSNWEKVNPGDNIFCIAKDNKLLLQFDNSNQQWNNLNNYVFLNEITTDNNPNNYPYEVVFLQQGQQENISFSLKKSIFDDYDSEHNKKYKWVDYFEYNNIKLHNNDIYYCIIKNELDDNFYKYIIDTTNLNNRFWTQIKRQKNINTNNTINYVIVDNVINISKGNINSFEGRFEKITIGNPNLEGEFNIYYKNGDIIEKNDIIQKLKIFDKNNENIKCDTILVSNQKYPNYPNEPINFSDNDVLYARYKQQIGSNTLTPIIDVSNININGLININKNAGSNSELGIQMVNLNNILQNLQQISEQLTFIQSINADSDMEDTYSYANLRCNSIIVKNEENNNILELTNKKYGQITDKYHMIIKNVIPSLDIENQGLPSEYYNLFTDDSFITKKYFEGNQSINITTPADIGTNDMPGRLNLYGTPDKGSEYYASVNLFYKTKESAASVNSSYTEFSMFGIETKNVNGDDFNEPDTFKINTMAVKQVPVIIGSASIEADVSNVNSIEMRKILLKKLNANDNKRIKIFYDTSIDSYNSYNVLNFNYTDLSDELNNDTNLLQLKYLSSNKIELNINGDITANNNITATNNIIANNNITATTEIITKTGFYVNNDFNTTNSIISLFKNNNNLGVLKLDIINTNNGGLIIEDIKNLENKYDELKINSYDSNIKLHTKKYTDTQNPSNIIKCNSYIKIKDNKSKITYDDNHIYSTGLIKLDNYNYKDLSINSIPEPDTRPEILTIYLQNGQIQMNKVIEDETTHETNNEIVFYVDKNGKVKCSEIELPGASSNIIVNTITFKNKNTSNIEKNLFKFTTQITDDDFNKKSFIIYNINNENTIEILKLEKTSTNINDYILKSYGFETFGTTNSNPNLKINNNGNLTSYGTLSSNIFKTNGNDNFVQIEKEDNSNQSSIVINKGKFIMSNGYTTGENSQPIPFLQINDETTEGETEPKYSNIETTKDINLYSKLDDNNKFINDNKIVSITSKTISINNIDYIHGLIKSDNFNSNNNKLLIQTKITDDNIFNQNAGFIKLFNQNNNNSYIEFNNDINNLNNTNMKIPTLFIQDGQIKMNNSTITTNPVFSVNNEGQVSCKDITLNDNITAQSLTFKNNNIDLFKLSTESTGNKSLIIYNNPTNSTEPILKLEKTGINTDTYTLKSYGFETFGTSPNLYPNLQINNDGALTTQKSITINKGKFIISNGFSTGENPQPIPYLQINDETTEGETKPKYSNIETTKDINLYSGLTNDNKFDETNKMISLSASNGKITANELIINNNGSSSLNNELTEDTQPKKYITINNNSIQLLDENNTNKPYININSYGIDSKSINIKDDSNNNKIYVGKYINNDIEDDTNKLIKIMYDENNKSYLEMYSYNGTDRKQKLLINDYTISTNNNIEINDNNNNLWLSIKKDNGIIIQKTDIDTNTTYKNIINYGSLKISTKTGSEEEIEQIVLSSSGNITAKSLTINGTSLSNIELTTDETYLQLTIGGTSYKIQLIPVS